MTILTEKELMTLLPKVERTVLRTAPLIRDMLAHTYQIDWKGADDPVTAVDHAVNTYLLKELHTLAPSFGWLSEETEEDPTWLDKKAAWVVDPIDGTKNMMHGKREFSVSVALVADGCPVLGCVFAPLPSGEDDLISGVQGGRLRRQQQPLPPPQREAPYTIITTPHSKYAQQFHDAGYRTQKCGSVAYRLATTAAGDGDATVGTRMGSHAWDIAAGHILAELGGCTFTDLAGNPVRYDKVGTKAKGFMCAPPHLADELRQMINTLRKA